MRLAWVCPYLPWPANSGGRIRIHRLASGIGAAELHLLCYLAPDDMEETATAGWPGSPWHSRAWFAPDVRRARQEPFVPSQAARLPQELVARLFALHDQAPLDAVIVEHCYAAGGLALPDGVPLIVDEHNIEADYYGRLVFNRSAELGPQPLRQRLRYAVEWAAWRRFQRRIWQRAAAVAVVAEADARQVAPYPRSAVDVVPNGVAVSDHGFIPPSQRQGYRVLFVGHLQYPPNLAAARFLATEILPRLRRRVPEATLTLAGRDPLPQVTSLAGPAVQVVPNPPCIAELYAAHAACAIPLRFGAGTSLKVLEPLAAGVPLCASAFGVRGFGLLPAAHYLPAESADDYADALGRILTTRAAFDPMAARGRRIAQAYAWENSAQRLARLIQRVIRT